MKPGEKTGAYLSALGGKFLAGKKAREDAEKNRRRLREAMLVSREFGAQRITDGEIKKLISRLTYEADSYIAAALETQDAFYEPLVLDALETARAALNTWKKNENDAAALKHLGMDGTREGIVIPREQDAGQSVVNAETRERTLGILKEGLRVFVIQNSIRTSGDPEAALAALAGNDLITAIGETEQ